MSGDFICPVGRNAIPSYSGMVSTRTAMIVVEKLLTALILPAGLVWLGLIALVLLAWRRRQKTLLVCLLALLALETAAGNDPLGRFLLTQLEQDYARIDPLKSGPFDAVVVLGGGTATAPNGQPQLDSGGDRVALGARLYHTGRTARLIATGRTIAELNPGAVDASKEAAGIWRQLAIADDRILRLPGRNTREEMAALREVIKSHPEWKRFGLVTSAFHMRRALRLAQGQGVLLEPLPADFRGTSRGWNVLAIIPTADGFMRNQLAIKEFIAKLSGK